MHVNAETVYELSIKLIVLQVKPTTSIKTGLQLSNYAKKFLIRLKKEVQLFFVAQPLLTHWETRKFAMAF